MDELVAVYRVRFPVLHSRAGDSLPDVAVAYVVPFDRCACGDDTARAYTHFQSLTS